MQGFQGFKVFEASHPASALRRLALLLPQNLTTPNRTMPKLTMPKLDQAQMKETNVAMSRMLRKKKLSRTSKKSAWTKRQSKQLLPNSNRTMTNCASVVNQILSANVMNAAAKNVVLERIRNSSFFAKSASIQLITIVLIRQFLWKKCRPSPTTKIGTARIARSTETKSLEEEKRLE